MIPAERRKQILSLLETRHYLSVEELAKTLYVSLPTIRRDLRDLEAEGAINRTHGGASWSMGGSYVAPFDLREKSQTNEKSTVAELAAGLIENNDTLFLSSGSTTLEFAKHINPDYHLEILTNGISAARYLSRNPNMNVYCPAGRYMYEHDGIFGPEVEEAVSRRFAKYGIVSCDGLHMERGIFSTIADMEQFLGKAFRKNCEKLVLLADHTKFNKVYYYRYMEMKDVDIIVTDDSPGEEWEEFLESHHIELLY